jgi:uncharacterized protein
VRVILDTNVFVSGVFFTGPPYEILRACREGRFQMALSSEILDEYRRVGLDLAQHYNHIDLEPFLYLIVEHAYFVDVQSLPMAISDDPDDNKFLACALASGCHYLISGDRHLLKLNGYEGISILKPKDFLDIHLDRTGDLR